MVAGSSPVEGIRTIGSYFFIVEGCVLVHKRDVEGIRTISALLIPINILLVEMLKYSTIVHGL